MANISSISVLEKLDSVTNCEEQSSAPIFKIPSPFWNQDSVFRRTRNVRESSSNVFANTFSLYPYRCDLASVPNPDLFCATRLNQIYPTLSINSMNVSSRYLPPSSKFSVSDPNTRYCEREAYYWSYLASETDDGLAKSFRNMHYPQIDPFLASYYYRGPVLRTDIPNDEIKTHWQKEKLRGETYWSHRPQKQRVVHSSKKDSARHCVKNNPLLGSLLHTDLNKNHHQLTLNPSSQAIYEESKQDSINTTVEELPLLDWSEGTEKHNQEMDSGTCSTPPSVLGVLSRFAEGSLVELEGGRLKHVEDLRLEDLEQCAKLHPELRLKRFTVLKISPAHTPAFLLEVELEHDHLKLCLEVNEGLPFFVYGRGWSSCNPQRTSEVCRLQCHQLKVGDVCLALTRDPAPPVQPANQSPEASNTDHTAPKSDTEKKSTLPRRHKSRKRHFTAPELRYTTPKFN